MIGSFVAWFPVFEKCVTFVTQKLGKLSLFGFLLITNFIFLVYAKSECDLVTTVGGITKREYEDVVKIVLEGIISAFNVLRIKHILWKDVKPQSYIEVLVEFVLIEITNIDLLYNWLHLHNIDFFPWLFLYLLILFYFSNSPIGQKYKFDLINGIPLNSMVWFSEICDDSSRFGPILTIFEIAVPIISIPYFIKGSFTGALEFLLGRLYAQVPNLALDGPTGLSVYVCASALGYALVVHLILSFISSRNNIGYKRYLMSILLATVFLQLPKIAKVIPTFSWSTTVIGFCVSYAPLIFFFASVIIALLFKKIESIEPTKYKRH